MAGEIDTGPYWFPYSGWVALPFRVFYHLPLLKQKTLFGELFRHLKFVTAESYALCLVSIFIFEIMRLEEQPCLTQAVGVGGKKRFYAGARNGKSLVLAFFMATLVTLVVLPKHIDHSSCSPSVQSWFTQALPRSQRHLKPAPWAGRFSSRPRWANAFRSFKRRWLASL